MFISIVIPTCNRPGFLAQCLAPLAAQLKGNAETEVHVVDDGSSPANAMTNRDLCALYNVNYHRSEKNHGMAVARNTGIRCSTGTWTVFLDDDFRVDDNWFATLAPLLRTQNETVVGIEGMVVPAGDGLWDREVQNLKGGLFITCHIAFRKKLLDAIGGFDPQFEFEGPFCEDHELAVRALRRGAIVFVPELRGRHLPRNIRPLPYIASSFKRIRQLLRADYYFFCKQHDWYHQFRHSRTFWGTFLAILTRNAFNTLRRRRLHDCVRHPLQFAVLIVASFLEQIGAWLNLPSFIMSQISMNSCFFHTFIDTERTAQLWRLPDPAKVTMLQFRFSIFRSLLFPVLKIPMYDKRPLMKRIAKVSTLDNCTILLRIDDVFLLRKKTVEKFTGVMAAKKFPCLAGITGNDLIDSGNLPAIERLRETGAEIAIHGFHHMGQFGPFESEILQMKYPDLSEKIAALKGSEAFKNRPPLAFMPPYNAISGEQIDVLSRSFDVITGGPETLRFSDRFMGPLAIKNGGWYIPTSYPFYSKSSNLLRSGVIRQIPAIRGFICITLHMTEEAKDGFVALEKLLDALPYPPAPWRVFAKGHGGAAYFINGKKGT